MTATATRENFFADFNFKRVSLVAHHPLAENYRDLMDRLIADAREDGRYAVSRTDNGQTVRLLIRRNPQTKKKA